MYAILNLPQGTQRIHKGHKAGIVWFSFIKFHAKTAKFDAKDAKFLS